MLERQRAIVVGIDNPGPATGHVREGKIGGIASVAEGKHRGSIRVDTLLKGVDRHTVPMCIERRPMGDAVDVDGDRLAGQVGKVLPGPASWTVEVPSKKKLYSCSGV
jgi:hypothetical protein